MSQMLNTTIKHIARQGFAYISGVIMGLRLCKTRSNGEIDEIIKLVQETAKQEQIRQCQRQQKVKEELTNSKANSS